MENGNNARFAQLVDCLIGSFGWCEKANLDQRFKIGYAARQGRPLEEIASMIWLLTETEYREDIISILKWYNDNIDYFFKILRGNSVNNSGGFEYE